MRRHLIAIGALILVIAGAEIAWASDPYVSGTYEPTQSGYVVRFTVYNSLINDSVSAWHVSTSSATGPAGPPGWEIFQDLRKIEWHALGVAYQVQPGASLEGFLYGSESPPGRLGWWIWAVRSGGYVGTVTPALIPEPPSLLVLAGGTATLGGFALKRRRCV